MKRVSALVIILLHFGACFAANSIIAIVNEDVITLQSIETELNKVSSFDEKKLYENFLEIYSQINKLKPSKAKGIYLKSITICSTMGPGIKIKPLNVKWKDGHDIKA